jgi:hypothetical protein
MALKQRNLKKIYFTTSFDLQERYERMKEMAKEKGLIVNFKEEFNDLFESLLATTEEQLGKYSGNKGPSKGRGKKSKSSTQSEMPLAGQE